LVSYGVKVDDTPTAFHYYTDIEFIADLRKKMATAKLVVAFNAKFDLHWARRAGVMPPDGVRVWDCQIAEFILRGQQGSMPSLNEALSRFELGEKGDKIAEYWAIGVDTPEIPVAELKLYNCLDVELTYKLYLKQKEAMTEKQIRLCTVMGLDLLVLEEMEWNGILLDIELCKKKAEETEKALNAINQELLAFTPTPDINLDSGHQLSCVLFGGGFELTTVDYVEKTVYKSGKKKGQEYDKTHWKTETFICDPLFIPLKGSETKLISKAAGKEYTVYATGEDVLKQLKKPTKVHRRIIELLLKRAELAKLQDTYYGKLPAMMEKMEWGNVLHGQYNQCVAATGRLSSSGPNMQNFSGDVDLLLVSRYD
jgi:DNA polymerase I-like protein with 3'-5' exonuclease and polymerase domains